MKEDNYLKKLDSNIKEEYQEGVKCLEIGKYEKAEELFTRIKELEPDFVPLYNKWAIIYIYKKDYQKARELLLEALRIDKKFAPAIVNLGNIMRELGDRNRAKEYYFRAIDIDKEYGPAYNNLGVIYREEGNYTKSVKYLKLASKYKSYHVNLESDKPFYKEPGCVLIIIISILIILFLIMIFR